MKTFDPLQELNQEGFLPSAILTVCRSNVRPDAVAVRMVRKDSPLTPLGAIHLSRPQALELSEKLISLLAEVVVENSYGGSDSTLPPLEV